jgi:hypothetical protein
MLYNLTILDFNEHDVNVLYTCYYGFEQYSKNLTLDNPPLHFGMPLSVDSILHSSVKFAWNFIDDVGFHETVKYLKYIYIYIYNIYYQSY